MTDTNATTPNEGVADTPDFDPAAALLERWADAEKPSDNEEEGEPKKTKKPAKPEPEDEDTDEDDADGTDDDQSEDADEDNDDSDDDEDDEATQLASDAHKVKLVVDGEERTVSVKDLKRLYGQEASLTRKSQEVAALRKQASETAEKTTLALSTLVTRAEEKWKPYADIDYLVAQTQLSAEDFVALRAEAKAAYDDYAFLTKELDTRQTSAQAERHAAHREAAKVAIEVLAKDIPNWGDKLYNDIRSFAIKSGLREDDVNSVVDPTVIKLLHKAMLYERGKTVATTKKVVAAKKTLKQSAKASDASPKAETTGAAKRLAQSGSRDDAAAMFLAKWKDAADD